MEIIIVVTTFQAHQSLVATSQHTLGSRLTPGVHKEQARCQTGLSLRFDNCITVGGGGKQVKDRRGLTLVRQADTNRNPPMSECGAGEYILSPMQVS